MIITMTTRLVVAGALSVPVLAMAGEALTATRRRSYASCRGAASGRFRRPSAMPDRHGGSEMLHVWFTADLRSAFAISAPRRELCAAGSLPRDYCRRR